MAPWGSSQAIRSANGEVYAIKRHQDELYSTVIVPCNQSSRDFRAFSYSVGQYVPGSINIDAATMLETNLYSPNQVGEDPRIWYGLEWTIPRIRPARFSTVRVDCTIQDEVIAEFASKAQIEVFSGGRDRAQLSFIPGQRDIRLSPIGALQRVWIHSDHSAVTCGPHDMFFVRLSFPTSGINHYDSLECFPVTFRLIEDPDGVLTYRTTSEVKDPPVAKPVTPQAPEWIPPAWLTPHASQPVAWKVQPVPKIELPEPEVRAPGETSVVDFRRLDIGEEKL